MGDEGRYIAGETRDAAAGASAGGTQAPGERDQLLRRLANLRAVVPVFAHELARVRRDAARLHAENRRLTREIRRLRRDVSPGERGEVERLARRAVRELNRGR